MGMSDAPRVALLAGVDPTRSPLGSSPATGRWDPSDPASLLSGFRVPTAVAGEAYLESHERLYILRYPEGRAVLEDRHLMFLLSRYVATTKYDALTKPDSY